MVSIKPITVSLPRPGGTRRFTVPASWNVAFLGEDPAEKFSAGFFHHDQGGPVRGELNHPYFALNYVLSGHGAFQDTLGVRHELMPGSLFFRFPDKPLVIERQNPAEWKDFAVALPKSTYQSYATARVLTPERAHFQIGLDETILRGGEALVHALGNIVTPRDRMVALARFASLLEAILSRAGGSSSGQARSSFVEESERFLSHRLEAPVEMPEIAALMGMGYESFRKKFTQALGLSPLEYRIQKRLSAAEELLRTTNLTVKEISQRLGYPTDADFIRQYTRHRHQTPGAYRRSKGG